jgi:hypothetical protein
MMEASGQGSLEALSTSPDVPLVDQSPSDALGQMEPDVSDRPLSSHIDKLSTPQTISKEFFYQNMLMTGN